MPATMATSSPPVFPEMIVWVTSVHVVASPNDAKNRIEKSNVEGTDNRVDPADPNSAFYVDPNYTLMMNRDIMVIVSFDTKPVRTLTVQTSGTGGVLVKPRKAGSEDYLAGDVVEIIVSPSGGYFPVWQGTDDDYSNAIRP